MISKKAYLRTDRVAEQLRQLLATVLLQAGQELGIGFVTLSHVVVSKDLSLAKLYITLLEDDEQRVIAVLSTLNKAKKFFRSQIASKMQLRIVPDLRFYYDETLVNAKRINDKLQGLMVDDTNQEA